MHKTCSNDIRSNLPPERLGFGSAPFAFTGIDFFGPFEVKIARSPHKRWCCLFTCLTVRAVHFEVCHNLSTDSCHLAIQRFVARRGLPSTFFSDNGTNFVGASNEIKSFVKMLSETDVIESYLTERSCQWKFNPPPLLTLELHGSDMCALARKRCLPFSRPVG